MANRKFKIGDGKQYNATMKKIDARMKKGENNLTDHKAEELRTMALAAQAYEKSIYTIPAPKTLRGLIELEMYQRKLKQKDLAKVMGLGESKVSQILNERRPIDVEFLKAANEKLGIDGNLLLHYA